MPDYIIAPSPKALHPAVLLHLQPKGQARLDGHGTLGADAVPLIEACLREIKLGVHHSPTREA